MFNLEQSIADWRRRLAASGVASSEVLDELEGHLRDDVERQVHSGTGAQQAFDTAVQRIGQGHELNNEFRTAEKTNPLKLMKRTVIVLGCIAFILLLWALVLPALHKAKERGLPESTIAMILVSGIAPSIISIAATFYATRKLKA